MIGLNFTDKLEKINIKLTPRMLEQFAIYFDFLTDQNKVMNLTTITEEAEVYLKHFYDSIYLGKVVTLDHQSILDVGAGAGFPSIPLKICFPNIQVTIIDSLNKRILFLEELLKRLDIKGVRLLHARVEEFKEKASFDIVSARAVARLNVLGELCIPFVKKGGYFIAYKSIHYQEELNEAQNCIKLMGGIFEESISYSLDDSLLHVLIKIKKINFTTENYPRSYGLIKKKPL